jgi:hypothetical protein
VSERVAPKVSLQLNAQQILSLSLFWLTMKWGRYSVTRSTNASLPRSQPNLTGLLEWVILQCCLFSSRLPSKIPESTKATGTMVAAQLVSNSSYWLQKETHMFLELRPSSHANVVYVLCTVLGFVPLTSHAWSQGCYYKDFHPFYTDFMSSVQTVCWWNGEI